MRYQSPPPQMMAGGEVMVQEGGGVLKGEVVVQQGTGGGRVSGAAGRRISERGVVGLAVDAGRLAVQVAGG